MKGWSGNDWLAIWQQADKQISAQWQHKQNRFNSNLFFGLLPAFYMNNCLGLFSCSFIFRHFHTKVT